MFSFTNTAPSSFNSSNLFGTGGFGATSSATTLASPFGNSMSFGGNNFSMTAGTSTFNATTNAPSKPFSGFRDANASNSSIFGSPTAPAFRVSNNSNFGIPRVSTYSFGQPSGFAKSAISVNQKGSRITSYDVTRENAEKIISISAMKNYENKSQDELRFEDYQLGDKGQNCGSGVSGTSVFGVIGVSIPFKSTASHQSIVNQPFQSPCSSPFARPSTGISPLSNGNLTTTASNPFLRSFQPTISNTFAPKTSSLSSPSAGSKVASYAATREVEGSGKLLSISGMPIYADKSHEELRLEDYQSANKDGPGPGEKSASGVGGATSISQMKSFEFSSAKPFAPLISASTPLLSASTSSTTSIFSPITNPWSSATSSTTSIFSPKSNPWSLSTSSTLSLTQSPPSTSLCPVSPSSHPMLAKQPEQDFDQKSSFSSVDMHTLPAISPLCTNYQNKPQTLWQLQPTSPILCNVSSTPSIGLQNSSTSSLLSTGALVCPSQPKMTPYVEATCSTAISSQPSTGASCSGIGQGVGHLSTNVQQSYSPSIMALQPSPVILPSVARPAVQVSVEQQNSATSIQYGISSLPVSDKAAPVRRRSSLIIRHSSLSRHKLAPQKYNPTSDKPKVPFFMDKEDDSGIVRNEVVIIPRENPRGWVCPTTKEFPLRADSCRLSQLKHTSMDSIHDGDNIGATCDNPNLAAEEMHHDDSGPQKLSLQVSLGGTNETGMISKHYKDVEAIMPKLEHADYYTVPPIQDLLSKEKEEPGFCCHVKDFVVGRHGYGSIKFLGETDVRMLDLDSAVHFNFREVIIYMDDSEKPPVGQGLNKPAEITLLNVRCINKSTGKEYKEGPMVNKYRDMLIKKAADQDAEFVSYDPVKGEWTFKVSHF